MNMELQEETIKQLAAPKCPRCKGEGYMYETTGDGDYQKEVCNCVISQLRDIDVHVQAGLVYTGKNEDGEVEWMGKDEDWDKLEKLQNHELS